MAEIPVPFTGQSIDTDEDASNILVTIALMAIGFVVLTFMQMVGSTGANSLASTIGSVLGFNPATGESDDGGLGVL